MVKSSTEHKAFLELEALGCPAVPAIIQQMDDRRALPDKYISLIDKSPQALESYRQYGVKRAVDALDRILNQLTGESFGYVDTDKDEAAQNAERGKLFAGGEIGCKGRHRPSSAPGARNRVMADIGSVVSQAS